MITYHQRLIENSIKHYDGAYNYLTFNFARKLSYMFDRFQYTYEHNVYNSLETGNNGIRTMR